MINSGPTIGLPTLPPGSRARGVLLVTSMAAFVAFLDVTIVNIAFPSIEASLGGSVGTLSWVLNGYSIVFAALLVPAGRLADRSGRKRAFLLGVAVFTAASALCAAAPDVGAAGPALAIPGALSGGSRGSLPQASIAGLVTALAWASARLRTGPRRLARPRAAR